MRAFFQCFAAAADPHPNPLPQAGEGPKSPTHLTRGRSASGAGGQRVVPRPHAPPRESIELRAYVFFGLQDPTRR